MTSASNVVIEQHEKDKKTISAFLVVILIVGGLIFARVYAPPPDINVGPEVGQSVGKGLGWDNSKNWGFDATG